MSYTVLHYLHCKVMSLSCTICIARGCPALFYIVLQYLHCKVMPCVVLHCPAISALQGDVLRCSTLSCTILHCKVMSCVVLHCPALSYIARGCEFLITKFLECVSVNTDFGPLHFLIGQPLSNIHVHKTS